MELEHLRASDGTGEAVLAHVDANRIIGSTVLSLDNVDNWNSKCIVVTGTPNANGYIDSAGMTIMYGHLNAGDFIIDGYAPGYTDQGNNTTQIAIVKMTTNWADAAVNFIQQAAPAGAVTQFAGAAAPTGWLLCDGASLLRTAYPNLFTAIGTTWGAVDGTHFNVPDARGRTPIGVGTGTYAEAIAAASVTIANDQLTISAVGGKHLLNGAAVVLTTSGGAPAGLTAGNTYYVVAVDATHIRLASTLANAVAGTYIDITSQGTGTHTLTLTLTARALADRGGEETHASTIAEEPSHTHQYATTRGNIGWSGGVNSAIDPSLGSGGTTSIATGGSGAHNNMQPFLALNYIIKT